MNCANLVLQLSCIKSCVILFSLFTHKISFILGEYSLFLLPALFYFYVHMDLDKSCTVGSEFFSVFIKQESFVKVCKRTCYVWHKEHLF